MADVVGGNVFGDQLHPTTWPRKRGPCHPPLHEDCYAKTGNAPEPELVDADILDQFVRTLLELGYDTEVILRLVGVLAHLRE